MDNSLYTEEEIPAVMTVQQLGAFLGVGRNTAYALVRSNQVKSLRIGKQLRIPRHAVLSYLGVTTQQ